MNTIIGTTVPPYTVKTASGKVDLLDVTGLVGCYVILQPSEQYKGKDAKRSKLLLTPDEVRELAYWLRVQADAVDEGRVPGTMR